MPIERERELLHIIAPCVRWIDPKCVKAIAAANAQEPRATAWASALTSVGINPSLYLWAGSTCVYPGVRRRISNEEFTTPQQAKALLIDPSNNTYAKQVWYRLNNAFDKLRNGYHMVHLFPHKGYVLRELIDSVIEHKDLTKEEATLINDMRDHGLPGLFTNPASMCFLPGELTRPTDADSLVRKALWHHALTIYDEENLLPPVLAPIAKEILGHDIPDKLDWNTDYCGEAARLPLLLADQDKEFNKLIAPYL